MQKQQQLEEGLQQNREDVNLLIHPLCDRHSFKKHKRFAPFIVSFFFFPLSCSLNCTKRKRLIKYTLTHYFVYWRALNKTNQIKEESNRFEVKILRFFFFISYFIRLRVICW